MSYSNRCLALLSVWGLLAGSAPADEWSRFRGPNGAGVDPQIRLPAEWSPTAFRWRVPLEGIGHASPVVWDDRIFISSGTEDSGERRLSCIDHATGELQWSVPLSAGTHPKHDLNSFASTTPVVDETCIYVAWGTPEHIWVVAVTHDGEEVWRTDLGPYHSGHGFGQSLIKYGDLVILPVEHQGDSFRAALDVRDGSIRWQVPCASSLHYATPCVRPLPGGGDELIFVNWEQGIAGVDPSSGEVNWSADVFDKSHIESSIASPVLAGPLVIGVSGWLGHGYEAVAVNPDAPDDPVVWKLDRGAPLCTTPLVVEDNVYFWSDQGIVTCVDAATGELRWRERVGGNYYASPVAAGNMVINVSTEGEAIVLAASDEFELLARNPLGFGTHATPAMADGDLILRTFGELLCLRGLAPAAHQ